jgi:hypothetical protein
MSDWAVVGIVMTASAVLIGFPAGVALGYAWRSHISHVRRTRYLIERDQRRALAPTAMGPLLSPPIVQAEHSRPSRPRARPAEGKGKPRPARSKKAD